MSVNDPLALHINGSSAPAANGNTFQVVNPMTGKPIYESAGAGISDYENAIQHAHAAFQSWSGTSPSFRRSILLRAADILTEYLEQDAGEILSNEVSAVPSWVRLNILSAAATLRESAGLATHIKGEIVPADRPGTTILVMRRPVGVVFAISPWNAPVGNEHYH